MRNFRIKILAITLILSLCKCEHTEISYKESLTATIECGVNATKAILIDNPGIRLESMWQANESIGVFGEGASNIKFSVSGTDISADGKTAKFISANGVPNGTLSAYSPYMAEAKINGSAITINIPSEQHYTLNKGVVVPDPQSNIMVATGSGNSGLTFRNAMAVLKIGQVFETSGVLKKIEFRDLSGEAVCGEANLSWNGGSPTVSVTGSGKVITLNCGNGVSFTAGEKGVFFLIVPARNYAKGFEISFIADSGSKVTKTVGCSKGKLLERSVVYLIGDVSSRVVPNGTSTKLKENAIIMTPEVMDKVRITSAFNTFVSDENGRHISLPNHSDLIMPRLSMIVPKEMNPAVGNYLIFDEPTDDLPNGGVYKIVNCNKLNDISYEILAHPEINVMAPFEEVNAGEPLVNEAGELIENGGIPLDLTSYIRSIKDKNGKPLEFVVSDGSILLSKSAIEDMFGVKTKAVSHNNFSSPKFSLNMSEKNVDFSIGGSLTLNTRIAVRLMQGELQYVQFTVTPEITTSLGVVLKAEGTLEANVRVYTIDVLPIPVAPGVLVVPQIVLTAHVGAGGTLQVSANIDVTQKLGTYSLAYNLGDGATLRWVRPAIDNAPEFNPSFGGLEGSLYVYGGMGVNTNITLYGMCGIGLENELTFKFGTAANSDGSLKIFLQPEFEVTPSLCFPFGSKKFEDLTGKVEFDPMWEKYIRPKSKATVIVKYNWSNYIDVELDDKNIVSTPIQTGISGFQYKIELEGICSNNVQVALLVYEGSGIKITPDISDTMSEKFRLFKDSGVEHLYSMFYMCTKALDKPSEKPFRTIEVGTYKAGTEREVFEGFASDGSYTQGQAYGVVPAIIYDGAIWIIDRGSSYYNPFIYYWPNRSNGAPYFKQ